MEDARNRPYGRRTELAALATAIAELESGIGGVVHIEGEPGSGKTTLATTALTAAERRGTQVLWATADRLSQHVPLAVMLGCLGVRADAADPRRAEIARMLAIAPRTLFPGDQATYQTVADELMVLVADLCADAPTAIVIDDMQWIDEASIVVFHRLGRAAGRLPLLLVGIHGTAPGHRTGGPFGVSRGDAGRTVVLGPLNEAETAALIGDMIGAPPSPALGAWTATAMGNPLHLRELLEELLRQGMIEVGEGRADLLPPGRDRVPPPLADALGGRLGLVAASVRHAVRTAALLGTVFAVADLAVLLQRPIAALAEDLLQAVAAGILVPAEEHLAFRHAVLHQTLYDAVPAAVRGVLHMDAARRLADARRAPLTVAEQLMRAGRVDQPWVGPWLTTAAPELISRAPRTAITLIERQLDGTDGAADERGDLRVALVRALLVSGQPDSAVSRAREALAVVSAPARRGALSWLLNRALIAAGDMPEATRTLSEALDEPQLPAIWRARLLGSLAMAQRAGNGHLDIADATARAALVEAENAGDAFATAYALADLWTGRSVRRDHPSALHHIDRALAVLGDQPDHTFLRILALHNRMFTLQNLARWGQARLTLQTARDVTRRAGRVVGNATGIHESVLLYWLGEWDDALAELAPLDDDTAGISYGGLRERGPLLLWHGVSALIAGRRDDRATHREHLRRAAALPVTTVADRENSDFLLAARAVAAEQAGDLRGATEILATVLDRTHGEMTLTHQWTADLVRLAAATDDRELVAAALRDCRMEAAAEVSPGRAATMLLRATGLAENDPGPLDEAVATYRVAGPPVDLAGALEDLAVVLAAVERESARAALTEAVELYSRFGATWDVRRAESRLRRHGVRRGVHGRRAGRAVTGWESLTDTERRVAFLVAEGSSTAEIAAGLFLGSRTVQTHVSRIIAKLGVRNRAEIVREALRHETPPK
ncbi:helix-turn-helix transcriptional regulator [Catenuloplanes atrovinosus]|uniref:DNA-binding CsgD family transcriptional regulator n=1 Tax=Catenuloplanes atrovinosus TaxID=137266 RepID=A0AAE4CAR6_9ACTN|nr:AAA family ATPase [Catenuloplanes atrovinosus]MDR7277317.1 DNA-binding CsgD family transcriptional regulator [Catenuloplanes atrovinosus]